MYLLLCFMRIIAMFIFVVFTNCTSTRPLTDQTLTREKLNEQLNVEDYIWVTKKEGKGLNLVIDSIEETYLLGHNKQGDNIIIPYSLIEEIKVNHFSIAKTVVLASILGLFIFVGTAGAVAF